VEEIAGQGVTRVYWFTDKDDLGRELQHDLYQRLSADAMRAHDPERDAIANMRRTFEAYVDALGSFGDARFFLRDAWVIPALDEAGRQDHDDAIDRVRGVLAAAVADGEIVALDSTHWPEC
jgi:AcrR family transcriptional regulator